MDLRERLIEALPNTAIRIFARPYIAGDSQELALAKAAWLARNNVASTIDVLGEDAASAADVEHSVSLYLAIIDAVADDERFAALSDRMRPSISLKPSSFVVAPKDDHGMVIDPKRIDVDKCAHAIGRVMARAAACRVRATIDMENHQWTDLTLRIYAQQFEQHGPIAGTVIQSRLLRTEQDVENLPNGCRIRLCIGIYNEPEVVALRDTSAMKARMIPLARKLFDKNIYVEFATHDIPLIDEFMHNVIVPSGIGPDQFETQTLMGVPRRTLIDRLTSGRYFADANGTLPADHALRRGTLHRLYVPFAEDWDQAIAYARRRLRHSPNIFWTGLINAPRVLYHAFRGR